MASAGFVKPDFHSATHTFVRVAHPRAESAALIEFIGLYGLNGVLSQTPSGVLGIWENGRFRLPITEPGYAERIIVLKFGRKHGLGEVLEADWTREAIDCQASD